MSDRPSTYVKTADGGTVKPLVLTRPNSDGSIPSGVPSAVRSRSGQFIEVQAVWTANADGTFSPGMGDNGAPIGMLTEDGDTILTEDGHRIIAEGFETVENKVSRIGDSMLGPLLLAADATADLEAAPLRTVKKQGTYGVIVMDPAYGLLPGLGEPTVDDGPAIQAAIDRCVTDYGGGRVVLHRSHRIASPVIARPGVEVGYERPPLANKIAGAVSTLASMPALWFAPTGYITVQHLLRNILCLPAGFATLTDGSGTSRFDPVTMRAALDLVARFAAAGNPIRITSGSGSTPRPEEITLIDIAGFGFDQLVSTDGGTRMNFVRVWGDNNGALKCFNSGGYVRAWDTINRCYLTSGVQGLDDVQGPITSTSNVGGKLAITIGPTAATTPLWVTGRYYSVGDQVYYGSNLYRAYVSGISGASPPVHTSGRSSDGGVTWSYKGAYTGTLYTPDLIAGAAYGGTGFLAAGDPIFIKVAPKESYTGNPTYPHYSTVGAPADVLANGGDILDPALRGRYIVQSIQTVSSSAATIVLTAPYDTGLAGAIVAGTRYTILPSARIGRTIWTENVDTFLIMGMMSKGARFGAQIDGSGHKLIGWNSEAGAAGENEAGEMGSIGIAPIGAANRFGMEASSVKSQGTLIRWAVGGRAPGTITSTVLRGAEYRTIDMVDGALDARVTLEGAATIHSRAAAGHLSLDYRGTTPGFSGDGTFMDRISTDTVAPATNSKRMERAIMGGRGVRLGSGSAQSAWLPLTVYAVGALAWNVSLATGDAFLYRVTARTGTFLSGSTGPQGATIGATEADGELTWICVGAYTGGWTGVHVDAATGTTKLRAQATGAEAPDVLCAETSATLGRGLYAMRGLVWDGSTTINPPDNKGLTIVWLNDTTAQVRMRDSTGTIKTASITVA